MESLAEIFKEKALPCPLCEQEREIKMSTKDKPYIVCDSCGVQLFVRRPEGIRLLRKRVSWWS